MADPHPELLLDACVVINLLASGIALPEFAAALKTRFVVAEPASREALYLPSDGGQERERVDIPALAAAGAIEIVELDVPKLDHYVTFAAQVDDGEASTLAVAVHRGLGIATDDRKARRLASEQAPPVGVTSTAEILRRCEHAELADRLPEAIHRIERRATFRPRRDDPDFDWWVTTCER